MASSPAHAPRAKKGPRILAAEFVASAPTLRSLPRPDARWPEVVFAGRSNVGKSSLINSLVDRAKLVRTSSRPGCTRALNFFRVVVSTTAGARELRFVDLPGYGYARVSKEERAAWGRLVEGYLADQERPIAGVVVICDARRGPEEQEAQLCEYLASLGLAPVVVVTKSDKIGKPLRDGAARRAAVRLGQKDGIAYSSVSGEGRDRLWRRLLGLLD